ncbi:MAG: GTP-binding protein [Ilumatobacter sp.]
MDIPITLIVSSRPGPSLRRHSELFTSTLIAPRDAILRIDATPLVIPGRFAVSEPDTYYRTPGCDCCASREDLIASIVRTAQRAEPPEHLMVLVDPNSEDVATVVATVLSSFEINRRCFLDSVVLHVDAVESATRLATGDSIVSVAVESALAIADRIVLDDLHQVTDATLHEIRAELRARAGFVQRIDGDGAERLDAWHGAPIAVERRPSPDDSPSTVLLRVESPLDADAIEGWLDLLVARHAARLLRLQGALSVEGHEDRTCCFGVRSFTFSHSENEHRLHRSTESVLAICGIGLDPDELTASFRLTVAS